MQILHASDLHSVTAWFDWLVRVAPLYDLVCLSGDLLDRGAAQRIDRQVKTVSGLLNSIRTPIAICSGNHCCDEEGGAWLQALRRKNLWVDGDRFLLGGHSFYCHPWNEPIPRANGAEIWVIHCPPAGSMTAVTANGEDRGDFEFAEVCASGNGPRLAFCGHVHHPKAWHARLGATLVFNPGIVSMDIPAHVVADLEIEQATRWIGPYESETTSLNLAGSILEQITVTDCQRMLDLAVTNQRIEGHVLSLAEIEECRKRLLARKTGW